MTRLRVRRTKIRGDWEVWNPDTYMAVYFTTWREALTCADREARTVTVEVPRILDSGDPVPSAPQLHLGWEYQDWVDKHVIWVGDHGSDMIYVKPDELKPLALALLALHYQQEAE